MSGLTTVMVAPVLTAIWQGTSFRLPSTSVAFKSFFIDYTLRNIWAVPPAVIDLPPPLLKTVFTSFLTVLYSYLPLVSSFPVADSAAVGNPADDIPHKQLHLLQRLLSSSSLFSIIAHTRCWDAAPCLANSTTSAQARASCRVWGAARHTARHTSVLVMAPMKKLTVIMSRTSSGHSSRDRWASCTIPFIAPVVAPLVTGCGFAVGHVGYMAGPVTEVIMPVDRMTRKAKGYALITYMVPENAITAYTELDGSVIQGRMLHLLPGKAKQSLEELLEKVTQWKERFQVGPQWPKGWIYIYKWGLSGSVDREIPSGAAVAQWIERFKVGPEWPIEVIYHTVQTCIPSCKLTAPWWLEWLVCSPSTKVNRVQSPAGLLRILHVVIMQDNATDRQVYSGISGVPCSFIPAQFHTHLTSSSSALKTTMLRAPNLFTHACRLMRHDKMVVTMKKICERRFSPRCLLDTLWRVSLLGTSAPVLLVELPPHTYTRCGRLHADTVRTRLLGETPDNNETNYLLMIWVPAVLPNHRTVETQGSQGCCGFCLSVSPEHT
ncbi:hypothetical protein PR048_009874 [Dryococelus australis]|uniref:RRM domain-containing protein n=1 Tax=Dryococelus australis TaxID=614101 RepID=A0ABQ9I155_9NEOP|nr:hypothetical protein PR048_009874 [Dryococelus australis]